MPIELQSTIETIPAIRGLGLRMEPTAEGLTFTGTIGPEHANLEGAETAHGGTIAAILDTAGTLAALLHSDHTWVTLNVNVTYLRATHVGPVRGSAKIVHQGRTHALAQSTLKDDSGRRCAEATVLLVARPTPRSAA